jgi:hypothetical protein
MDLKFDEDDSNQPRRGQLAEQLAMLEGPK